MSKNGFLEQVHEMGDFLKSELIKLQAKFPKIISEVRGIGLMIGIELNKNYNNQDFVKKALASKLLVVGAGCNVVRLLPPLIITKKDAKKALGILEKTLSEM